MLRGARRRLRALAREAFGVRGPRFETFDRSQLEHELRHIVDRAIAHGFQVAPAELEALLLTHPQIADAAVIGLPDDAAGEIPAAYVVLKPGQDATVADIRSFVAENVASYKQVRRLTFVDAIPKSASGKILRRVLRDQATQ